MNWKNFRPLKGRLILRPCQAEVSDVIVMLDYPSSTCEVVASSDDEYPVGSMVIVDRSMVASFNLDDEYWAAYGSSVLALVRDDQVYPVPGLVIAEEHQPAGLWRPVHTEDVHEYTLTDGRRVLAAAGAGWIITYKGKTYRVLSEEDLLAELSEVNHG